MEIKLKLKKNQVKHGSHAGKFAFSVSTLQKNANA